MSHFSQGTSHVRSETFGSRPCLRICQETFYTRMVLRNIGRRMTHIRAVGNVGSKFCTHRSSVRRETWALIRALENVSRCFAPVGLPFVGRHLVSVRALANVGKHLTHVGLPFCGRHGETFGSRSCLIKYQETFGTRQSPRECRETFDTRQCLEKCREKFAHV